MKTKLLSELFEALHYLHVAELKNVCIKLGFKPHGAKGAIIEQIMLFIKTGNIPSKKIMPIQSKAQKNIIYPLAPETRMLYGSYKNDACTRAFFKQLIGNHFHFTAAGIDWLNERWMNGNPPTYQEFAQFWQDTHEKRKRKKPTPKKEWAYINFIQHYLKQKPDASQHEITTAWEAYRKQQVIQVNKLLKGFNLNYL